MSWKTLADEATCQILYRIVALFQLSPVLFFFHNFPYFLFINLLSVHEGLMIFHDFLCRKTFDKVMTDLGRGPGQTLHLGRERRETISQVPQPTCFMAVGEPD